ncbi:MAG: Asp-tRNA(Asn)/Glu-tRNA(Gln) amidotransferase subunit GatC [Firmicutes bacterium]|nr:Asp-tRNA(Asn)/Glu-tRNA(Gln) amidotransferase subunit GatC [Bacillota bacterium]
MKLEKEKAKHLAELARLEVSEEEAAEFSHQLSEVLDYAGKVREAPVEGVEPTIHLLPLTNVFRDDEVKPFLTREEALVNAPRREEGFFRVPRILEEN